MLFGMSASVAMELAIAVAVGHGPQSTIWYAFGRSRKSEKNAETFRADCDQME